MSSTPHSLHTPTPPIPGNRPTSSRSMRRAALYARVSTDRQREDATIESQISEIAARAREDGNLLVEDCQYRDDGYSGELLPRPGLDQLRDDARRRRFEVLYVYDRGRLSRKFAYQELIIEELTEQGIEFVTLHDTKAETPEERVLQAMQGVFHEYERVKIAERFRRGKLFKVRSGQLLGYNPAYGYDYHRKAGDRNGYFTVNEAEARVVRMVFSWVADEKVGIREAIRRLYRLGIPPRKQRRPTWTTGPIQRMLREETYTGLHYYNRREAVVARNPRESNGHYRRVKKTGRRTRPREEWIPVQVPAIISRDLFERVQQQLRLNAERSPRNTKREYLLRGLIYCPCGQRRSAEGKGIHLYYRCNDRINRFPLPRDCTRPGVCATVLDTVVWQELVALLTDPERLRQQAEQWLTGSRDTSGPAADTAEHLAAERRRLREEEERYARAYGEGVLPLDLYRELAGQVAERHHRIEEQSAELSSSTGQLPRRLPSLGQLVEWTQETIRTLDFANRRHVVTHLVARVTADQQEAIVVGSIPLQVGERAGLRPNDTDGGDAILPFHLKAHLPEPDLGGRGYSPAFLRHIGRGAPVVEGRPGREQPS